MSFELLFKNNKFTRELSDIISINFTNRPIYFWFEYLSNKNNITYDIINLNLKHAICEGNFAATKFYFRNLNREHKEKNLEDYLDTCVNYELYLNLYKSSEKLNYPEYSRTKILVFLLKKFNTPQLKELLKRMILEMGIEFLLFFVSYQFKHLFFKYAKTALEFEVEEENFAALLIHISMGTLEDREFYEKALMYVMKDFKKKNLNFDKLLLPTLLDNLFRFECMECAKMLFTNLSQAAKVRIKNTDIMEMFRLSDLSLSGAFPFADSEEKISQIYEKINEWMFC